MTVGLRRSALSWTAAVRELEDDGSGGVVLFAGRVRPDPKGHRRVEALRYEADPRPALRELLQLADEARDRFGARRVVLWHRIGTLRVGELSVIVGVAAPHRASAFRAARFLIDALKRRAPIWKTDVLSRGSAGPTVRSARTRSRRRRRLVK